MAKPQVTTLRGALAACRGLVGWTVLFSAGINLLYLAPSLYMMQVYDRVLNTGGMMTLALLSAVLLFALAIMGLLDMTRTRVAARLGLRLNRLLAPVVMNLSLARAGPESDATRAYAVRDFDTLRQVFTSPVMVAALDTPWTIVFVAVCFIIHPLIGAATLGGGIVLLLIALRHEHVIRPTVEGTSALAPRYYAAQEGDRTASEAVRALGMRGVLIERQLDRRNELIAVQTKAAFVQSAYGAMSRFWRMMLQSAVLGLGAYLAVERQISPGALIAGSILAARALAPLEQVVAGWRQVEQARVAYRNLVGLIDEAPPQAERTSLPSPEGRLSLESVSVRVPQTNRLALHQVSFSLTPGEIVGVIGPSGAGKSTLARIVVGAIAPDTGVVRLDGANLNDWEPDALGANIGYLPQDVSLLAGTVGENIRRFAPASPQADALTIEAAQMAGAHDMILRLPKAYDTMLGPGGRGLSLGQGQRVALARALFGAPNLLVLDEPNAHLDGEGEVALIQALKQSASRGASVLVVAHKPSVVAIVDRLLLMREGNMDALGSREEIAGKFVRALEASGGNLAQLRAREGQQ